MRNMPSLDTEYAHYPKKSLLLETYFWRFKDIRSKLSGSKYVSSAFTYLVKKSPGFYHYLTASLLGCEARLVGHNHFTATMLGLFSKLGYKGDKFIKAFNKRRYDKEGLSYVKYLLKKQGFKAGVETGYEAGMYGSRVCGKYVKSLKKEHKHDRKVLRELLKNEVDEIEDSFDDRKKAVFSEYVSRKREIERATRESLRMNSRGISHFIYRKEKARLREVTLSYFHQIEAINGLIDEKIDELAHQDRYKKLLADQKDELMPVDLSRAY